VACRVPATLRPFHVREAVTVPSLTLMRRDRDVAWRGAGGEYVAALPRAAAAQPLRLLHLPRQLSLTRPHPLARYGTRRPWSWE
jgi:hypothetical protein